MGKRYDPEGLHNPQYPRELGATVAKFRTLARRGLRTLTYEQRREYGEAVGRAILAKQRSEAFAGFAPISPKCNCASGTAHNDGAAIHAAVLERQRRALLAAPDQERRKRKPWEWQALYNEAMKGKNDGRKHSHLEAAE